MKTLTLISIILLCSCADFKYGLDEKVCIDGETPATVTSRYYAKQSMSFTHYPEYEVQYKNHFGDLIQIDCRETRLTRCK